MDHSEQIDHAEHAYLSELCPMCDQSPCAGGDGKGSCDADTPTPASLEDGDMTDEHTARETGPGVSSYYTWSKDGQLYGGLLEDYARSEEVAAHHGQSIGRPYRVVALADDTVILEEN